jgi:tRNA A-37 threonylcarbamoyl transferase component Bud32
MHVTHKCPHCRAELPPDAPDGVCPRCVLGLAFGNPSAERAGRLFDAAGAEQLARDVGAKPSPWPVTTTPLTTHDRFVAPDPEDLARHFPQLEILELLGQGGMGAVYKARQRRLDRLVALKVLPPEVAGHPTFEERFTREARALARLNHPHIVTLHDFGEAGGLYYFLMEFVDGVNLRQTIAGGKLDPREALAVVPQVCEALQYAHDEGVVHRDIKPENILLDRKGRVKIADFGLAKLMRNGDAAAGRADFVLTGSQQVMGTPHYMAPEQLERPQGVDHRADIYSLGVVFYEMLTGELPLGRFAPPSRKVQIDVRLDEVVLRSLEKEPERRYQQASDVRTDVQNIAWAAPRSPSVDDVPQSGPDVVYFRDAGSQVALPALGLGIVGGVGFILSFILLFLALDSVIHGHAAPFRSALLVALTLPISLLIAAGGSAMARLQWCGLCRAASILAVLPCHLAWLIGMPAGLCAWTVLNRAEVRAGFQGKESRTRFNKLERNGLVIAIGCLIGVLLIGAYFWPPALEMPAAVPTTPAPAMPLRVPLRSEGWILGPAGPALTDEFARPVLNLQPRQIERVNKIFQAIYAESLVLEARNTQQLPDDTGHVVVTIKPYHGPIAQLEDRLWSQLDEILDPQQQSMARLNLDLGPRQLRYQEPIPLADLVAPGFFGWGKDGARIELWRVGSWYHWKVQARGYEYSTSAPQLPVEYRRFWKGSPSDRATQH